MSAVTLSVVIPAHNEGENLVDTVGCLVDAPPDIGFEVIVVDDLSTDGSADRVLELYRRTGRVKVVRSPGLGAAGARNLGAESASGEVLVFLDAHCYVPSGWWPSLTAPLANPSVGLVGPAVASLSEASDVRGLGQAWSDAGLSLRWLPQLAELPYSVPLLGACGLSVRRGDFERLGGYDRGMTRWGSEDTELCLRAWLMGYEVLVQPQVVIYHLFRTHHTYAVDGAEVLHNLLRLALLHFSTTRCTRVFEYYRNQPTFPASLLLLLQSDVMQRRSELHAARLRDDDWFMERFGCVV